MTDHCGDSLFAFCRVKSWRMPPGYRDIRLQMSRCIHSALKCLRARRIPPHSELQKHQTICRRKEEVNMRPSRSFLLHARIRSAIIQRGLINGCFAGESPMSEPTEIRAQPSASALPDTGASELPLTNPTPPGALAEI